MSKSCFFALMLLTSSAIGTYGAASITGIDSSPIFGQQQTTKAAVTPGALESTSYSYTYTVTTPTTLWNAPTFATLAPIPVCSDSMCPTLDHKTCKDTDGTIYGVLCDARFAGIVITNNGKRRLMDRETMESLEQAHDVEKRTYQGSFDRCSTFCDEYDVQGARCQGVAYDGGFCMAYDTIYGALDTPGQIAAVRQT